MPVCPDPEKGERQHRGPGRNMAGGARDAAGRVGCRRLGGRGGGAARADVIAPRFPASVDFRPLMRYGANQIPAASVEWMSDERTAGQARSTIAAHNARWVIGRPLCTDTAHASSRHAEYSSL